MRLAHIVEARQQQSQRIDPRQIQASEILAWTTSELEAAVEREMAENPALETRDGEPLPLSDTNPNQPLSFAPTDAAPTPFTLVTGGSGQSGDALPTERPQLEFSVSSNLSSADLSRSSVANNTAWEDELDPLERVASGLSLRDHLRGQIGQVTTDPDERHLIAYLIESLDERGYLTVHASEVAERFRVSSVAVEQSIRALQTMDPPGIGARDLRECLLLQVDSLEQSGEAHPLARRVLALCWEDLVARREERIVSRLRVPAADVKEALRFLRASLTPHPGASFRPEWSSRGVSSGENTSVRPDLIFRRTDAGFAVEMTRDFETTLTVAPLWKRLAEKPDACADEAMRRYLRDHVDRAQSFLSGVARRGQTLRRIAACLVERQQGYLETGNRAFLRPLTRQTLAEELCLDESVVSRAVAEKWVQLPGGDVVPLDAFFGNAHAIRDALAHLIAGENTTSPYSDDEIADILTAQGYPLARRTVAKYRGLEKILPARLRRRTMEEPAERLAA